LISSSINILKINIKTMEFSQEQKTYAKVVQKAWDDADFKKELTANPVEAIEKLMGKKLDLPTGKTLVVRDQTDESTVYINIPAKPNMEDIELSEEQLEVVAGGGEDMPLPFTIPVIKWR
jgi:hypothetical protein